MSPPTSPIGFDYKRMFELKQEDWFQACKEIDELKAKLAQAEHRIISLKGNLGHAVPSGMVFDPEPADGQNVLAQSIAKERDHLRSRLAASEERGAGLRLALEQIKNWNFATDGRKFDGNHKEVLKHIIQDIVKPALSAVPEPKGDE